jgi:hypothetical protein
MTKTSSNLHLNVHDKNSCFYQPTSQWHSRKGHTNNQKQTPRNYSAIFHFQPKMNNIS